MWIIACELFALQINSNDRLGWDNLPLLLSILVLLLNRGERNSILERVDCLADILHDATKPSNTSCYEMMNRDVCRALER